MKLSLGESRRAENFIFKLCALCASVLFSLPVLEAQNVVPPYDLWNTEVQSRIRDRSTLELRTVQQQGYSDLFFTSNPSADWFDAQPPYAEHNNEKITIHAFLAAPPFGGPYPALVIGHGHHGRADRDLATIV